MARQPVAEYHIFKVGQADLRLASGEREVVEEPIEGRIAVFEGHVISLGTRRPLWLR